MRVRRLHQKAGVSPCEGEIYPIGYSTLVGTLVILSRYRWRERVRGRSPHYGKGYVMSFTIQGVTKDETAYDKYIQFTYEGETYSVYLHWDKWDGYEVNFTEIDKTHNWIDDPEWAISYEDNDVESLAYVLDNLSDETLEASYL